MSATDAIPRPEASRGFTSASHAYALKISNLDNWRTAKVSAELSLVDAHGLHVLWRKALPHHYGPRFVFLSDKGAVVLVDEWRNSPSIFALTLVDRSGASIASYDFDSIVKTLGVPRKAISTNAKMGLWMAGAPVFTDDQMALRFKAGGREMLLLLSDGKISARD